MMHLSLERLQLMLKVSAAQSRCLLLPAILRCISQSSRRNVSYLPVVPMGQNHLNVRCMSPIVELHMFVIFYFRFG